MDRRLESIRSFRPRSALDDFLERTVIHEEAGAPMPRILVGYALLGAILTAVIGVLGLLAADGATSGFMRAITVTSWLAVVFGALLVITATCLSRARSALSRTAMKYQLIAGAFVPGTAAVLVTLYLAIGVLILWLLAMILWAAIDP